MGSLTSWVGLYKPASTDLVDPKVDMQNNFINLDTVMKRQLDYKVTTVTSQTVTSSGIVGDKLYNLWNDKIYVHKDTTTNDWTPENGFIPGYSLIPMINGWNNISSLDANYVPLHYRYSAEQDTVTVRGHIRLNSYDALTANTAYITTNTGAVPTPTTAKYAHCNMGVGVGNTAQVARIFIQTTGYIEVKMMGTAAAAGSVENSVFVYISYPLGV